MSWDAGLPVVSVPHGDQPHHVTFIYPYYENPRFLAKQIEGWANYPSALARHLSVILVDDGSPTSPAEAVLQTAKPLPIETRLFRIDVDVPWNWLASRNIGAKYACGWCVLTDMDHMIPVETARSLVYGQHDPSRVYAFSRRGSKTHPHSASFYMTRDLFWKIRGYDETFSGLYGNDGPYRRQVRDAGVSIEVLTDHLVLCENMLDSYTTAYPRKDPADAERAQRLRASLLKDHTPKVLSFPYHEVTL